jgi:hypothetical protein
LLKTLAADIAKVHQQPWGREHTSGPAGGIYRECSRGMSVTCRECRAGMCTDELLSKLRCAECRQIKFEVFCDVAIRAGLILSVSCLVVNLITRFPNPVSPSQTTAVDRRAA